MLSSIGPEAGPEALGASAPLDVFRHWGVVPDSIHLIQARSNAHWTVIRDGRAEFVLRRYRRGQSAESVAYEFEVLRLLAARGQPVAAPAGPAVRHGDALYALFPMLTGAPKPAETQADARARGRLLGLLHLDLTQAESLGQRPGWQRTDSTVAEAAARGLGRPPFGSAPSGLAPEDVAAVGAHLEAVAGRLAATLPPDAATGVVHGDFIAQNLLFTGDRVTGLLDLDSTHFDLRAADVACARRSGNDAVVRGYTEAVRLTDAELSVLDDLWRAGVLRYAVQILEGTHRIADPRGELAWCLRQLGKTRPFNG